MSLVGIDKLALATSTDRYCWASALLRQLTQPSLQSILDLEHGNLDLTIDDTVGGHVPYWQLRTHIEVGL